MQFVGVLTKNFAALRSNHHQIQDGHMKIPNNILNQFDATGCRAYYNEIILKPIGVA
jgi:hypothetical protein